MGIRTASPRLINYTAWRSKLLLHRANELQYFRKLANATFRTKLQQIHHWKGLKRETDNKQMSKQGWTWAMEKVGDQKGKGRMRERKCKHEERERKREGKKIYCTERRGKEIRYWRWRCADRRWRDVNEGKMKVEYMRWCKEGEINGWCVSRERKESGDAAVVD